MPKKIIIIRNSQTESKNTYIIDRHQNTTNIFEDTGIKSLILPRNIKIDEAKDKKGTSPRRNNEISKQPS
jgi:hypothetical protein